MDNIKKNYFYNLIYQVLVLCVPLITAPYLSRVLGADKIGEYSFAQSIVSYFSLFAVLGTSLYGQREIAYEKSKNGNVGKVFTEIVIVRAVGVAAALICYFVFVVPSVSNHLLYVVAGIELLAVVFDISWFYQGIEEFQNITVLNGATKILGTVLIFLFVKSRSDLEFYVVLYCGSMLFGNILQWTVLKKYLNLSFTSPLEVVKHLRGSVRLFVSQLAIQLYTVLDKTMIGIITKSDFENGYYEQSQKLVKMATAIVTAVGTVVASRVAVLYSKGYDKSQKKIWELLEFSFSLVFCMSLPIMFGIIVISSRFVPLFYGAGYDKVIPMISALSAIVPAIGTSNIIGIQLFVPSGRENLLTKSVLAGSAVNVILNSFLIAKYGAMGAIIASIVAEYCVTGVQLYLARREISFKKIALLFFRYLLFSLIMFLAGIYLSSHVSMGIGGLLIIIIACVFVYGVELIIFKDPLLKYLLKLK